GNAVSLSRPVPGSATELAPVRVQGSRGAATEGTGDYAAAGPSSSATGLRLTQRETPQSMTIMAQQRIQDQALNDIGDILKQVTGVTVDNSMSDLQNYYVRGFQVENF